MAAQVPPEPSTRDTRTFEPGTLSALLADLVRAPEWATCEREPDPGTVIDHFELLRRVGRGGFGVVWEAHDRRLDRLVAFKLVRSGNPADLGEESLRREADAAAGLAHDNIVTVHDLGRCEFGPYLVLELLRGSTLADRMDRDPVSPREAVRIVRGVARGVAHAHRQGVVHRDLKPANVFVCQDGRVKVLDFGMALAFGRRRRQSGGTPAYMAPEQWRDAPEDERTDVFALGVILYRLLAGAFPFDGETETTSSRRAPALELADAPELGWLIARMLEKDPVRRPRDAGEVLGELETCLAALEGTGRGQAPVRVLRHPRRRLVALVAAGVAAGVVAGMAYNRIGAKRGSRPVVTVADVLNETDERELDVLARPLVTSLEQSGHLLVMTQAQSLDVAARLGHKGLTRVDEAVGREVGRKSGASALLLPAVRKFGANYAVEMRAIDPVKDQHLFTVSDRSPTREGLFDLLDRLAGRVRRELHEDPTGVEGATIPIGDAMTRSIEAYQHYLAGIEAWFRDGRRAAGLRELSEAVRIDPQFAAAHGQLALLYSIYGRPDLAEAHRRAVIAFTDRMPEKERMLLRLGAASSLASPAQLDQAEALRLADDVVARFPEDKFALAQAASAYSLVGISSENAEASRAPRERAEATLRRALDLDPGFRAAADDLVGKLIRAGRQAEALEVARRAVATRRSAGNVELLAEALLASGDDAGAGSAARESIQLDGGQNSLVAGAACFVLAQLQAAGECVPLWERMMREGQNPYEQDIARARLVETWAVQGRIREALALLGSVEEARRGDIRWNAYIHEVGRSRLDAPEALAQARRIRLGVMRRAFLDFYGQVDEAEGVLLEPGEKLEIEERVHRAFVDAHRGRHAEAVEGFRAYREAMDRDFPAEASFVASHLLAEALLAAGRPAEAAEIWPPQAHCRCRGVLEYASSYPRLALVRARAMEQLGRKADAVRELDGLIAFWKDADEDLPLLVEAKAMRTSLARAAR